MVVPIRIECPKCHADRTMLETTFAVPGCADGSQAPGGVSINPACALPVRLVMCPRCHLIEMYHDVGRCKLG